VEKEFMEIMKTVIILLGMASLISGRLVLVNLIDVANDENIVVASRFKFN
jgi:hypothetical protein